MRNAIYIAISGILMFWGCASYLPQIIRLIKTRSSNDLSLSSWAMWSVSSALWMTLLILDESGILVILIHALELTLCLTTLVLGILFRRKRSEEK